MCLVDRGTQFLHIHKSFHLEWKERESPSDLFPTASVAVFEDVVLAERAGGIYEQPLVYTGTVEMVATWQLAEFDAVIIGAQADATFSILSRKNVFNR